jgi:CobQ-like glutamine amidotransferase family enzyme
VDVVYQKQPKPADTRSRGTECYFCGGIYALGHSYPAKGKTCTKYSLLHHFTKVCQTKVVNAIKNGEKSKTTETAEKG